MSLPESLASSSSSSSLSSLSMATYLALLLPLAEAREYQVVHSDISPCIAEYKDPPGDDKFSYTAVRRHCTDWYEI